MIHKFLEMTTGEQLAWIAKMSESDIERLKSEFACLQERKRFENANNIKLELARQFSEDTKRLLDRRRDDE